MVSKMQLVDLNYQHLKIQKINWDWLSNNATLSIEKDKNNIWSWILCKRIAAATSL
jgi:hypothetical protein